VRRFWLLSAGALGLFLLVFLAAEGAGIPLLQDPLPALRSNPLTSAFLSFGLLAADSVIPVPASLVMTAHGAIFGFLPGALLSLAGSVASALITFGIGRAGREFYARFLGQKQEKRAAAMLRRWGPIAIVVTRPVPLLAETVGVMAGAAGIRPVTMILASVLGNLPPALLYAWVGAADSGDAGIWPFLMVLLISGLLFLAGRRLHQDPPGEFPP
jgi:uncharacterized membrane protein YdjX (TVP38/TMEM64 family)